jgi:hypothetical protein
MSNYVKATNFTAKDSLPGGNSGKIIKGAEIDTEFTAIASAVSSKADSNSPAFTGTPTAPTATLGTNTTQLATASFVKNAIDDLGTIGTMAAQDADDVAITGGSITGITDLAVADGGTGASTLTGVVIGNGTSAMTAVAPSTSGNVLTSNGTTWASTAPAAVKGLGIGGEVWNNVTGSRASNTTYTNSRSYPIAVSAGGTPADSGPSIQAYVNDVLVSHFNWQFNGAGARSGAYTIVPPGATYRLVFNGSGIAFWAELY